MNDWLKCRRGPHKIVLVDDEEMVTRSLSTFLRIETDYEVVTFENPVSALDSVRSNPFDVVVSDFFMPEMNGLQFLKEVRQIRPEAPRIMLTGYADKENAIKAINEVDLFYYLEKPWDNDQLKLVIDNAVSSLDLNCLLREKIQELDRTLRDRDALSARDEKMQRELDLAKAVHSRLLPEPSGDLGGLALEVIYRPAMEVGGDFYSTIDLDRGRKAILLADIMGHGIQAALSTTLVKFAFDSLSQGSEGPVEILKKMNDILRQGLPGHCFVAAAVAVVEPEDRIITVGNAGLPHAQILRRYQEEVMSVPLNGMFLGFADEDLFRLDSQQKVELDSGDCLLLFTDGLTESADDQGRQFGEDEMIQVIRGSRDLSCREMLDNLVDDAIRFGQEQERDDITLLSLEAK